MGEVLRESYFIGGEHAAWLPPMERRVLMVSAIGKEMAKPPSIGVCKTWLPQGQGLLIDSKSKGLKSKEKALRYVDARYTYLS